MEDKLVKEIKNNVGYVWINRPDKKNALDADVWFGLPEVINELDCDDEVRCIVIAGKGDSFSAGIDITMFMSDFQINEDMSSTPSDRKKLQAQIKKMQDSFTALSKTSVPVIALAHGHSRRVEPRFDAPSNGVGVPLENSRDAIDVTHQSNLARRSQIENLFSSNHAVNVFVIILVPTRRRRLVSNP